MRDTNGLRSVRERLKAARGENAAARAALAELEAACREALLMLGDDPRMRRIRDLVQEEAER